MATTELLRYAKESKEKRLLLVAQKAGAMEAKAMSEGNRDRAYHFMRRMYRLLHVVASIRSVKDQRDA